MQLKGGWNHVIAEVKEEKDLGVLIDNQLNFRGHVQHQVNEANVGLGSVRHTFKYLDHLSIKILYKSLIRPHLEYATVIWSPQSKRMKDAIEQVQRRATRLVVGMDKLSYSQRLRKLELPTLEFRRQRADQIQIFKLTHNIDRIEKKPCPFCNNPMLQASRATTTRGHPYKYQIQNTSGARRYFLTTRAIEAWNRLSAETLMGTTVNAFKAGLAKDWKHHPNTYEY